MARIRDSSAWFAHTTEAGGKEEDTTIFDAACAAHAFFTPKATPATRRSPTTTPHVAATGTTQAGVPAGSGTAGGDGEALVETRPGELNSVIFIHAAEKAVYQAAWLPA